MIIGPLLLELGLENQAVAATGALCSPPRLPRPHASTALILPALPVARVHPRGATRSARLGFDDTAGVCRACARPLRPGAFIVLVSDTSVAAQFALLGLLTSADAWRLFAVGYLGTAMGQSVCDRVIRKTGRSSVVSSAGLRAPFLVCAHNTHTPAYWRDVALALRLCSSSHR